MKWLGCFFASVLKRQVQLMLGGAQKTRRRYRRYLDFGAIGALWEMKRLIDEEANRATARALRRL
jgi:hypothetical protein